MYDKASVVVPVIVPAQLSDVVDAVAVAEHSPVISGNVGAGGGVASGNTTILKDSVALPVTR